MYMEDPVSNTNSNEVRSKGRLSIHRPHNTPTKVLTTTHTHIHVCIYIHIYIYIYMYIYYIYMYYNDLSAACDKYNTCTCTSIGQEVYIHHLLRCKKSTSIISDATSDLIFPI